METKKSVELRKKIDEQLNTIAGYVDDFELSVPKDETALEEISILLETLANRVKEMDDARIRRKQLLEELNKEYVELEESRKSYVDKIKLKTS